MLELLIRIENVNFFSLRKIFFQILVGKNICWNYRSMLNIGTLLFFLVRQLLKPCTNSWMLH